MTTASDQPQPNPDDNSPKEPCPFTVGQVVVAYGQRVQMTVDGYFPHPMQPIWIVSTLWFAADNTLQRGQFDAATLCDILVANSWRTEP